MSRLSSSGVQASLAPVCRFVEGRPGTSLLGGVPLTVWALCWRSAQGPHVNSSWNVATPLTMAHLRVASSSGHSSNTASGARSVLSICTKPWSMAGWYAGWRTLRTRRISGLDVVWWCRRTSLSAARWLLGDACGVECPHCLHRPALLRYSQEAGRRHRPLPLPSGADGCLCGVEGCASHYPPPRRRWNRQFGDMTQPPFDLASESGREPAPTGRPC